MDEKIWIGIEENSVVHKVLHVMFKIRLKQWHIVRVVYCKTNNTKKDA